jgi:hypothetical protein
MDLVSTFNSQSYSGMQPKPCSLGPTHLGLKGPWERFGMGWDWEKDASAKFMNKLNLHKPNKKLTMTN